MGDAPDKRVLVFPLGRDTSNMLRGVAILLVMLGHTRIVSQGGFGGVALFLILSGFGLNCSCEQHGLKDYWRRRVQKVWLPYFFVGVLDVFLLKPRGAGAVLCTLTGLDLGLIADPTMWYISYIIFWYLAYYLLTRLFGGFPGQKKRILIVAGLLFACVPCVILGSRAFWHPGSGSKAYFLFFPLGVGMSVCREIRASRTLRTAFWTAVLLGCAAYLCLLYLNIINLTYLTAMATAGAASSDRRCCASGRIPIRSTFSRGCSCCAGPTGSRPCPRSGWPIWPSSQHPPHPPSSTGICTAGSKSAWPGGALEKRLTA